MLGKLMKHELNATSRLLVPLYIVLLFISLINRFVLQLNIREGIFIFFTGFLVVAQVILIFTILVTTALFMIIRFYKNLLSDEGYLMFTLPVNSHQLIISKLIVTLFWIFVSIIIVLSSLYITFVSSGNMSIIIQEVQRAFAEFSMVFGGKTALLVVELIIMIIVSAISNILIVYASIAIGQLFSKHKIIASFVSYAVIYNAIQLIMIIALVILSIIVSGSINFTNVLPNIAFQVSIIVTVLACVAFYIITNHIFEKKLNLD